VDVDVEGDVVVDRLEFGGIAVEAVKARVTLRDGVLRVEPLSATVYEGSLDGALEAQLASAGPPFTVQMGLTGTRVGQLVAALDRSLGKTMTGALAANVVAGGRGGDLKALGAEVHAEVRDGKLTNHPVTRDLARLFGVPEFERLSFDTLRADLVTEEGEARVERLVVRGPSLQAMGTGSIGLLDRSLDLRLAMAVPQRFAEKLIPNRTVLDAVTDSQGWAQVPLRLRGSLAEPAYGLDVEALGRAVSQPLQDKAKKLLEEKVLKNTPAGEKVEGLLDRGVKSLFGQ
jgi:AsmA protein